MEDKNNSVEIICLNSSCHKVPVGSRILLNGPMLDMGASEVVCMTALQAVYPFVIAARFGVPPAAFGFTGETFMVQCPDKEFAAEFEIRAIQKG